MFRLAATSPGVGRPTAQRASTPNPECGTVPYFRMSRYHWKASTGSVALMPRSSSQGRLGFRRVVPLQAQRQLAHAPLHLVGHERVRAAAREALHAGRQVDVRAQQAVELALV